MSVPDEPRRTRKSLQPCCGVGEEKQKVVRLNDVPQPFVPQTKQLPDYLKPALDLLKSCQLVIHAIHGQASCIRNAQLDRVHNPVRPSRAACFGQRWANRLGTNTWR